MRSQDLYERALRVMPGGNTRSTVYSAPHPHYADHGEGYTLEDVDGHRYFDFLNNYTVLIHGHAHPAIVSSVRAQMEHGFSFSLPTESEIELASILTERLPAAEQIRFTNSGSEAVMMAIQAARALTGRPKIAKFEGAYHGTYDAVAVSQNSRPEEWGPDTNPAAIPLASGTPAGVLQDIVVLPFDNQEVCSRLIEKHADQLAAILVDPVPHRLGLIPASRDFLTFLREISRAHDILLVSDEVLSLRIGYNGAHGALGYVPDLIAAGKIIGGGLPVGAVGGSERVMSVFDPRQPRVRVPHGGTFNANPLTMTAGRTAMELLTREAVDRLNRMGESLRFRANEVYKKHHVPGQATGAGSLFLLHPHDRPIKDYRSALPNAAEKQRAERIHRSLQDQGILLSPTGLGCLSTPMQIAQVDAFIDALDRAVQAEARAA